MKSQLYHKLSRFGFAVRTILRWMSIVVLLWSFGRTVLPGLYHMIVS